MVPFHADHPAYGAFSCELSQLFLGGVPCFSLVASTQSTAASLPGMS